MPSSWGPGGLRCSLCLRNQVFAADPCSSDFDLVQLAIAGGGAASSSASSLRLGPAFGVSVHPACLRAADGLGGGCCDHSTEQVLAEVSRCAARPCSYCQRPGATVRCRRDGCRAAVHFPCLVLHGKLGRKSRDVEGHLCKAHAAELRRQRAQQRQGGKTATKGRQSSKKSAVRRREAKADVRTRRSNLRQAQAHAQRRQSPPPPPSNSSLPRPLASPPLLRLASPPRSKDSFTCAAAHCRCPFGKHFSEPNFWPVARCAACPKSAAHRFCTRRDGGTARGAAWRCAGCRDSSNRSPSHATDLNRFKKSRMASASSKSPVQLKSQKTGPKAIFNSMKMSFCRVIDSHLGHQTDLGAAANAAVDSVAKRRAERSPLGLRQKGLTPPKESPGKSSLGDDAVGKENCQRRITRNKAGTSQDAPSPKDEWILSQEEKTLDSAQGSPKSPVRLTADRMVVKTPERCDSLPRGRDWAWGSPSKKLPKGWSYIVEDPLAGIRKVVPSVGEEPAKPRTRPSPDKVREAFMTAEEAKPPPPTPSATVKKPSPAKSGSGSSSPAKKFVDNSFLGVDHGALVRKLEGAFDAVSSTKPKAAGKSKRKSLPATPAPSTTIIHGKKEPRRQASLEFVPIERRLLYHVRTTLPIERGEAEAEEDYEWLVGTSDRLIDDFLDLNEGEKAFFKLWNAHLHYHPCYGDAMMIKVLQLFVEQRGRVVAERGLYRNYLVHLASLHDFGVLDQDAVQHFTLAMREKCRQTLILKASPTKDEICCKGSKHDNYTGGWLPKDELFSRDRKSEDSSDVDMKSDTAMKSSKKYDDSRHMLPPCELEKATSPTTRAAARKQFERANETASSSPPESDYLRSRAMSVGRRSSPASRCSSRHSSERSMRLYLSESDVGEEEKELEDVETRSPPRKRRKRTSAETSSGGSSNGSSNAAVSYAGDRSVDRISDNGAVRSGLCCSGTRRSGFAANVVHYPGRGRRGRGRSAGRGHAEGRGGGRRPAAGQPIAQPRASAAANKTGRRPGPRGARRGRPPRQRQAADDGASGSGKTVTAPNVRKRKAAALVSAPPASPEKVQRKLRGTRRS